MENNKDMQKNQVNDDELEDINGGRKLWDLFTAEFTEFFDKPRKRGLSPEDPDENGRWGTSTLEMRVNAQEIQERRDSQKVMKL